jgi:hypothetical protein
VLNSKLRRGSRNKMPMRWRWILDSTVFVVAVGVAAGARYGLGTSWSAAVGWAVLVFLLIPFVGSRLLARFIRIP